MPSPTFPITPLLPDIVRHLAEHPRLVLEAPPGAGKTTQVPLALLDEPWTQGRRHHHDAQVLAQLRLHVECQRQTEIGRQMALVEFVEQDRRCLLYKSPSPRDS